MIKESINQEAIKNPKQSLFNVPSLKYMELEIQGEIVTIVTQILMPTPQFMKNKQTSK